MLRQAQHDIEKELQIMQSTNDLDFLKEEEYVKLRSDIEYISNQLNALYNKLAKNENS